MFSSTITSTSQIWLIAAAAVVATRYSPCIDCSWTASGLYNGVLVALACRVKDERQDSQNDAVAQVCLHQSINLSLVLSFDGSIVPLHGTVLCHVDSSRTALFPGRSFLSLWHYLEMIVRFICSKSLATSSSKRRSNGRNTCRAGWLKSSGSSHSGSVNLVLSRKKLLDKFWNKGSPPSDGIVLSST